MRRFAFATTLAAFAACAALATDALAHPPWGIAADPAGRVYFTSLETVWKVDERGRLSVLRPGVAGRHTHELTLGEDGNLYGEDLTYEPAGARWITAVWKAAPSGELTYLLAPTDRPPLGTSIWRDRDGNAYSAQWATPGTEFQLVRRSPSGQLTLLMGDRRAFERWRQVNVYNVGGTAFGPDGALYFTDRTSVFRLGRDGAVSTFARDAAAAARGGATSGAEAPESLRVGGDEHGSLLGLAVDAQGNVYAADAGGGRVLKITPGGAVSVAHASERGWQPTGVACAGASLYVLEFGVAASGANTPPRVLKLAPGARPTVLASVAGGAEDAAQGPNAAPSPGGGGGGSAEFTVSEVPASRVRFVAYGLGCAVAFTLALAALAFRRRRHSRTRGE